MVEEYDRRHSLKEEIKREVLQELMTELALEQRGEKPATEGPAVPDRRRLKEELRREILAELERRGPVAAPDGHATGAIIGFVSRGGKGAADVEIQATKLVEGNSLLDMFESVKYGARFTCRTDAFGSFKTENVPVGGYEIRWRAPGWKRWLRRLREDPDVIVQVGKTVTMAEIRLDKGRVVGHGKP